MEAVRKLVALCAFAALMTVAAARAAPDELAPVWTYPAEGRIASVTSSPTVYENTVFIGADDGSLYALYATGPDAGALVPGFPIRLDGSIKGRPAVYGDRGLERVYVATTSGSLYAFQLDGASAWPVNPRTVGPASPIVSTPAVRGLYVYVTTSDGRILRFLTADGRPAGGLAYGREVETRLAAPQRVSAARAHIEVEDATGFFPAGRLRISVSGAAGAGEADAVYTYSGLNTASKPNRLLNLSPVGVGFPTAELPRGAAVFGSGPGVSCDLSPAVPGRDDATLVITALNGVAPGERNLVALKSEGNGLLPQWEAAFGARITTAPLVQESAGRLYIGVREREGDPGGRLYAVQASNGQQDARWPNGGYITLPASVEAGPWLDAASERLYFGTADGRLYSVRAEDGAFAFPPSRLAGADAFLASPVVAGARLYLGSHNGRFYSVAPQKPADARVYVCPKGGALDSSPSASGGVAGRDVVVVGSAAGKILAFPVE